MKDLKSLIDTCISTKQGSRDFALFYVKELGWRADIGNSTNVVMLGEIDGEYQSAWLPTPEEAVAHLLTTMAV